MKKHYAKSHPDHSFDLDFQDNVEQASKDKEQDKQDQERLLLKIKEELFGQLEGSFRNIEKEMEGVKETKEEAGRVRQLLEQYQEERQRDR